MHVLPRVLFQVQTRDLNRHRFPFMRVSSFITISRHDFEGAMGGERLIVLRDLITLRQVGIKIILAREDRTLIDAQAERLRRARTQLNRAPIQNRQSTRQAETYGTGIRVRLVAKTRGAPTKDF